jgi:TnpA family transposase
MNENRREGYFCGEGQEDQLGALGLVVNMIVLWNTIYIEAILEQLRKEGYY